MIEKLTVKDLAVVENTEIVFGAGLNVVTGETGAGKSVLIGAIDLLTGGRADHAMVRHGAAQSVVTAELSLNARTLASVAPILDNAGIDPCEDGLLILKRTIPAAGNGRCSVNNCPATAQTLRAIGVFLADMHGPHDNQSLLSPAFQLDALDAFGHCHDKRAEFAAAWQCLRALQNRRDELAGIGDAAARELDLLRYQIDEISAAALSDENDGEALVAEHAEAANASRLLDLGSAVADILSEGENAAIDTLAAAIRHLDEIARLIPGDASAEWLEEARSVSIRLNELTQSVASAISRIDASPERMAWLEDRMALVEKLKRKYGKTIPDILEFLAKCEARADDLESREANIAALDRDIAHAETELKKCGAALTALRKKASEKFAAAVSAQLADLGLKHARFSVAVAASPAPRESGLDAVEFGFAPNPGEPERPLRAIASSGEISRVMLAGKTVLAEHDQIPVLVFDEIDANIGGEIAHAVGKKLARVSDTHQVICITHLPQVAACGAHHFAVVKTVVDNRTQTHITRLDPDQRVDEIARMLGGAALTSVTLDHARELLAKSHDAK